MTVEHLEALLTQAKLGSVDYGVNFSEWSGGDNPAPNTLVEIILQCGNRHKLNSNSVVWAQTNMGSAVVNYRVIEGATS